jgi:hypothetical protein
MIRRIIVARIYQRSAFVVIRKTIGFVFRPVAYSTSKQEIGPLKYEVGTSLGSALWPKMFDISVLNVAALGLPKSQQNERSALTLLALLDLPPDAAWPKASAPLRGITPIMDWFAEHYGKRYAPNTRETVRRQTVHQFMEAGIIIANPDKPTRPINSGQTVYQVEKGALGLLRTYGTKAWEKDLRTWLTSVETLKTRYARERNMLPHDPFQR